MIGLMVILLAWLAGNLLSALLSGYVSGNVLGMLILFVVLKLGVVKAETVRPAAKFLLGTMALFFIPYGVGLMESYTVILDNLWAIVVAAVLSTVVVLLVSGHTFQWVAQLKNRLKR
ncbi:MAG: CidA/LrgA family protein [Alistipes sp.]|nr:CidA/LrgA family protein [Alistipes sp.]